MSVLRGSPTITKIQLVGLDTWTMPVGGGDYMDPYIVKQIDGLDPPDQLVAIADTASGGRFQGKKASDRELVFLVALNSADPKSQRNELYTMLNTGYDPKVQIKLFAGITPVSTVAGYVTRFEAALYVKDPVVQFAFTCLNPTFKAPNPTKIAASSLSERHPNIYNPGTAEAGFQFAVKFNDDMPNWFIKVAEDQSIGMTFVKNFHQGDILAVSTVPGQRYIHWNKKKGAVQNKMGILTENSEWIKLHPGANRFVLPPGAKWQWRGPLSFTPEYWGV